MTTFLEVSLYVIAAWFALGAIGMAIVAANRPAAGLRAALLVLSAAAAFTAAVLILAAGDLK